MGRVRQRETPAVSGAAAPGVVRPRTALTRLSTDVAQLLRARAFQLGAGPAALLGRLSANLQAFGGGVDPGAAAWIGEGTPPADLPSISLGEEAGTLGPRSFGFLNNVDGVAPLCAPMAERPRKGGVALVVPRRDALPELVPLLLRRRLGVSWLISVGDGDPAEVIRFLGADPATTGILVALGRGVRATTLHGALGGKHTVLLELAGAAGPVREGLLCRAVARRAGATVVGGLEEWLAHGALVDAAAHVPAGKRPRVAPLVLGAGADFVAAEAQRARLPAPLAIESGDPHALAATLAQAAVEADLIVLCGDPEETAGAMAARPLLRVDPAQPDRLRALFQALALRPRQASDNKPVAVKPDADRVAAVMTTLPPPLYENGHMVLDEPLSDHDAKRLLRAYGARVSRQAPANTVTAVLRVAGQIGLPVALVPPAAAGTKEREPEVICPTQAELKRQATLLLSRLSHLMVREVFPDHPRLRLTVTQERGLGGLLRVDGEAALLPLLRAEARELAEEVAAAHGCSERGLLDLFTQVSTCAQEHPLTLDLEIFVSDEPAVVSAAGTLRRPGN